MKKFYFFLVCFVVAASFLFSCATVDKPVIKRIKEQPKISKTIQHQKIKISSKTGLKRKVAIARFSNETNYGQSFFIDKNNDRVGKQAVDILSSKLIATEKF